MQVWDWDTVHAVIVVIPSLAFSKIILHRRFGFPHTDLFPSFHFPTHLLFSSSCESWDFNIHFVWRSVSSIIVFYSVVYRLFMYVVIQPIGCNTINVRSFIHHVAFSRCVPYSEEPRIFHVHIDLYRLSFICQSAILYIFFYAELRENSFTNKSTRRYYKLSGHFEKVGATWADGARICSLGPK